MGRGAERSTLMDTQTAEAVVLLITTLAAVAWLAGVTFLLRSNQRKKRPEGFDSGEPLRFDAAPADQHRQQIIGHAEIEGDPEDLVAKAAAVLVERGHRREELIKILSRTRDTLTFEGTATAADGSSPLQHVWHGEFRFTARGPSRTAVDYAVEVSGARWLLLLGWLFVAIGLLAVITGFALIWTWVVHHPNAAVRGQSLQMMQVVHFLWPPFLLGGLYRLGHRSTKARFDALAFNLPYYDVRPSVAAKRGT